MLDAWRSAEQQGPEAYACLRQRLPSLHFMSATVFSDPHYDPILALEVNFDGAADTFWAQFEAGYGTVLQDLIRCCKRPNDSTGALFDAAVARGSRPSVASYLKARAKGPIAGHQGNRGLDRQRIEQDAALFLETRRVLAQPREFAGATPVEIHARLRAALLPRFPFLGHPAPRRVTAYEKLSDLARLAGGQTLLLLGLSLPGIVLSPLDSRFVLPGFFLLGAVLTACTYRMGGAATGSELRQARAELTLFLKHTVPFLANPVLLLAALALLALVYVAGGAATAAVLMVAIEGGHFGSAWVAGARLLLLGWASMVTSVPALLVWLRWLELRDPSQDEPPISAERGTHPARQPRPGAHNHMASLVLIKPGVLRGILIRVALWNVGLILRALATDGYLGSMRTIHFAHWSLASNGGRLLFFSNFDGSWESYLDDFVERAHGGLSLAWGNCVGFPPSRFLVLGGASHGRRFKAWAQHSMAPALLWFSAYPDETVNQIERQARLAEGLCRPTLSEQEAAAWVRTL